jgi:hypothetical protein
MNSTPPIAFEDLLRLRRSVANILPDKVVARHRDKVAAPHIA